ncbi:hypothetical protein OG753_39545 [Streptomyces sp. NBC_00029]|uniref:hypothetical protein n=1 Tax=Streptomyces sp. NBC_00029 TaxID=2903613 RepID=UPI00324882B1
MESRLRATGAGERPDLEGVIGTFTPDRPDAGARPRRTAGTGRVLLGCLAGIVLTAVALTVAWWPRTEVTYRSTAPAEPVYDDRSPHYLGLVHEQTLSGRQSYRMVVGRYPGVAYGHWVDVETAWGAQGIESTTWTEAGVRVRFRTGHEVFVPARFFLHGR